MKIKSDILIYAAAKLARELHKGQSDKGGHDYFTSHLLQVAKLGNDSFTIVVGFLHDAAEDCEITEHDVILRLQEIMDDWAKHPEKYNDLVDEFEELMRCPNDIDHPLRDDEWNKIEEALKALNHHRHPTREEYIENIKKNQLAIRVKLNDLKNNMDLSRIPNPSEKDIARKQRYEREYKDLLEK